MANKINVFHLINSFEVGGLEKLLYYFLKNCDFQKFNMMVGGLIDKGPLRHDLESLGLTVFAFGLQPGLDLTVIPRLRNVMQRENVDILHTHNLGPHFYGSIAALTSGVPLKVHTEHGVSGETRAKGLLKHRYLDRRFDYVVAVSPQVETFLRNKWKPRCNIATILNGVEFGRDMALDKEAFRKLIGARPGDRVIGHVGRISRIKDQSTLLRAFRIIYEKIHDCHLVIVGSGPLYDNLVEEAKSLTISDKVHFMGERHDVPGFLTIFDVFALSSASEGISIALLEAMAYGVVPVVTDVGGNRVVVKNGYNGYVTPVGDEKKLAEKIIFLLDNGGVREELRKNAMVTVQSEFSIRKMVSNYEAIYEKYAQGKTRSRMCSRERPLTESQSMSSNIHFCF